MATRTRPRPQRRRRPSPAPLQRRSPQQLLHKGGQLFIVQGAGVFEDYHAIAVDEEGLRHAGGAVFEEDAALIGTVRVGDIEFPQELLSVPPVVVVVNTHKDDASVLTFSPPPLPNPPLLPPPGRAGAGFGRGVGFDEPVRLRWIGI